MEFFDEFEIIGGLIPSLIGLAFFVMWLFISIKPEKQKLDEGKSTSSPIKMILFAKAQIIGGLGPNVNAFGLFLGTIGDFL